MEKREESAKRPRIGLGFGFVERANAGQTEVDPSRSYKFGIEDRISCSSRKVTYNKRHDYVLSQNGNEIVRPRVPFLEAFLANFSAPEMGDFYSTALKRKTTQYWSKHSEVVIFNRTAGLTSFPEYLVLHMRRFVMEAGWGGYFNREHGGMAESLFVSSQVSV
ncbi:hypothetical protein VNO78_06254 [Psophocarpus tetragonolobus]|uniref:Uncharacterized protein n=1 Tax=Psophocarpus tetragonolobus TaxID=3891 RepID=A0AAN9SS15_PSOTE